MWGLGRGAFCALGGIILATGCADIACVNTPARVPPYQAEILAQPEWRKIFSEETIAHAQQAKQVAVFDGDFSGPGRAGEFRTICPEQYYVLSELVNVVDEHKDATQGCAVSAHELTHLMLYYQFGDANGAHDAPVWMKIMAVVSLRVCGGWSL